VLQRASTWYVTLGIVYALIGLTVCSGTCKHLGLRVRTCEHAILPSLTSPRGRNALETALSDPVDGLYTYNNTSPLGRGGGLRDDYRFGLYSHCAYISNITQGRCSNVTAGTKYQPYDAITSDMPSRYANITNLVLPASASAFRNDGALGTYTTAAYWLILIATIAVALAFLLYDTVPTSFDLG
jgi:hypothetical protein